MGFDEGEKDGAAIRWGGAVGMCVSVLRSMFRCW